jgi:D-inositol-3-phosphate glycosyltransferase
LSFINRKSSIENWAVALLTGGGDRPYVVGLATALASNGAAIDLIGSDELDGPNLRGLAGVTFLNLRGNQQQEASLVNKVLRILTYYAKLIRYAAKTETELFHILWNNKFESFDRTLLMLYYRFLGKRIVLTAHNVNTRKRDSKDGRFNRLTLGIQYRLADHIFVHTEKMREELSEEFRVPRSRITVIPFGINNSVPNTRLTPSEAKRRLGIRESERTILFFGRIKPYKGLEYLLDAFRQVVDRRQDYRLVIVGKPFDCATYWSEVRDSIQDDVHHGRVLLREDFIPDGETEIYFKGADVVVLPYRDIYQSGVLFLGHSFGLPALASDVGSMKDDIVEGETGFVFRSEDPADLARVIERYFASDLYAELNDRRPRIREHATRCHSWDIVSETTMSVYADLLHKSLPRKQMNRDVSSAS